MNHDLFGSEPWQAALDKYAEATGLTVQLYGVEEQLVLGSSHLTSLTAMFRRYAFEPGLFIECARWCLSQTDVRPAVVVTASGLTVLGASLVLEGKVVGAAVAGYALAEFSNVAAVQRLARTSGMPFDRLWNVVRGQSPAPERRLILHGELLQVLGDALLRENHRTRQNEELVRQLQAAAAAKDEFLAVLSHELRTPLAAIAGWSSVLKMSQSMEHAQRAAEAISRNVWLQTRLIEDLLDISRIASGKVRLEMAVHELQSLIHAAVETSAPEVEKKSIHLEFDDSCEPVFVEGDSGRLQQVFRNVLSNSVKFTPAGGRIRVSLSRDAGIARLVVTDTGVGIAPEFMPFVFDMFRQEETGTRREFGGLGIGLALVKRLVELHNGTVRVASMGVGRGTEVTIELPVAVAAAAGRDRAAPRDAPVPPLALAGLSVLVVEDVADTRESLRELLQLLGARVTVAGDGRAALNLINTLEVDLVLCDLRMPRMDGFEFLHELNCKASNHPPVVAMSGLVSEADRARTHEAGFEGHIEKPFDGATVVAAVDAACHRAGVLPEATPRLQ